MDLNDLPETITRFYAHSSFTELYPPQAEAIACGLLESSVIVADEIHLLDSMDRGPTLEVTLTKLKTMNPRTQILALSATVSNADEIAHWLGAQLVRSDWRPVALHEGLYLPQSATIRLVPHTPQRNKSKKAISDGKTDPSIALSIDTLSDGGQC